MNLTKSKQRLVRQGFTLMELLTVMLIIGLVSAVSLSAFGNSGSRARKAASAELLGVLTRARAEAITSGRPVAVTFVGTDSGPDRLRGKAVAIHSVRRDESSDQWEAVEQLQRWKNFPSVAVLLDMSSAPPDGTKGDNVFAQSRKITVQVIDKEQNQRVDLAVPFLVFESSGSVVYPNIGAPMKFYIGEGNWHKSRFTLLGKTDSGKAVANKIVINRLSGRARQIPND